MFKAIDEVAEHILAMGEYALPYENEKNLKSMVSLPKPLEDRGSAQERTHKMIVNLINLNEEAIEACQAGKKAAVNEDDDETEDLLIARIQYHQEANWMLKSIIKE